jgi:hypothetical protein
MSLHLLGTDSGRRVERFCSHADYIRDQFGDIVPAYPNLHKGIVMSQFATDVIGRERTVKPNQDVAARGITRPGQHLGNQILDL